MPYTKNEIDKLLDYLLAKAERFGKNGLIRSVPKYKDEPKKSEYFYLILDIPELGEVRLYRSAFVNEILINGVRVSEDNIDVNKLCDVDRKLTKEMNKYKYNQTKGWFEDK